MRRREALKIVVTAGPTIEPIDPVRFLSNFSTGMMGCEIAKEASARGHRVRLIDGPITALDMKKEVERSVRSSDCLIMAAAVCDYRPARKAISKTKRKKSFALKLVRNPDILSGIKKRKGFIKIGFSLETAGLVGNAARKMKEKGLDLIVANLKKGAHDPFGEGRKDFVLIRRDGVIRRLRGVSKRRCAAFILDEAEKLFREKRD